MIIFKHIKVVQTILNVSYSCLLFILTTYVIENIKHISQRNKPILRQVCCHLLDLDLCRQTGLECIGISEIKTYVSNANACYL